MLKEDQNAMVNLMLTKLMKIQHGIRAGYLQNSLITESKIMRFTTLLQFVVAQDLNLVKLVEQPIVSLVPVAVVPVAIVVPVAVVPVAVAIASTSCNAVSCNVVHANCNCTCSCSTSCFLPVTVAIANCQLQLQLSVASCASLEIRRQVGWCYNFRGMHLYMFKIVSLS
jgi:hypothetical protein